jgi:hypothetical protein
MGTGNRRPAFLKEAEERAQREGTSVKEALAADRERLRASGYPGPDCLDPGEIEQLVNAASAKPVWVETRLGHVEECDDCATLLLACEPGAASLERTIATVRDRVAQAPEREATRAARFEVQEQEPVWEVLLGLGPFSLVLTGLWAWGASGPTSLPARAVSVMGWAAGASVLLTLVSVAVSRPVADWLGRSRGTMAPVRFAAGALVVGLAAAVIMLGLGLAGFRLAGRQMSFLRQATEAAVESEALQALALRHRTGKALDLSDRLSTLSVTTERLPDGAVYASSLGSFGTRSATLVARVTDSGGEVFWRDPKRGEIVPAAELYIAKIVAAGPDELTLVDSNGTRHVAAYDSNSVSTPPPGSEVAVALDSQGRVKALLRLPPPDVDPRSAEQTPRP